jgi:hypothetical protein
MKKNKNVKNKPVKSEKVKKTNETEFVLNENLLETLASNLEVTINDTLDEYPELDPRIELLTTLLSFAGKVAQDLEITQTNYLDLAKQFFQDLKKLQENPSETPEIRVSLVDDKNLLN